GSAGNLQTCDIERLREQIAFTHEQEMSRWVIGGGVRVENFTGRRLAKLAEVNSCVCTCDIAQKVATVGQHLWRSMAKSARGDLSDGAHRTSTWRDLKERRRGIGAD